MNAQSRETEEEESSNDIISTLPDSLLCHILSFLPTQHAVVTSLLSTRWRPLWTQLPILHLDQFQLSLERRNTSTFLHIMSTIWTLRNAIHNPTPLNTFRIYWWHACLSSYVHKWISAIIPRGLQDLDIAIFPDRIMELPLSIFFSTTLVTLKLHGYIYLNPPSASAFPTLRILQLKYVTCANSDSLSTFLTPTACPLLQHLTLFNVASQKNEGKFNIIILLPTLKTLHLCCTPASSFKLHLNTPALQYFFFKAHLEEDVVLENLSNLAQLLLQLRQSNIVDVLSIQDYAKRLRDFIQPFSHVISLAFSIHTTKILYHVFADDEVPVFHNLSSLKFHGFHNLEWRAIQLLLCRAPNLQILAFESGTYFGLGWREEPLDVPECLSSHLTTCHYKEFSGLMDEMQLVRHILKAARVLKTMTINVGTHLSSEEKLRICNQLMKFPISSQTCQITFDGGTSWEDCCADGYQ